MSTENLGPMPNLGMVLQPSPYQVVKYLKNCYEPRQLVVLAIPFDAHDEPDGEQVFLASDLNELEEWILRETDRLFTGRIACLALIIRIFDFQELMKISNGSTSVVIPCSNLYAMRFEPTGTVGFDVETTRNIHLRQHNGRQESPTEPGIRYCDSQEIIEELLAHPELAT